GEGRFDIPAIEDSGARIDINNAPRAVLVNLFTAAENPGEIADNVMAWRGYAGPNIPLPAVPDYSDTDYGNKNAPFDAASELLLVKGVTREIYYGGPDSEGGGMGDLITVYPKTPTEPFKVNLNTASAQVLAVLFRSAGLDEAIAIKIVDDRGDADRNLSTRDDNVFCRLDDFQAIQQFIKDEAGSGFDLGSAEASTALTVLCNWLTVKGDYFKFSSTGSLNRIRSNISKTITCIVKRNFSSSAYSTELIGWIED
ncbi:MAG: type II secretion system protein GspK, partial [Candidatus Omnitrophica bacterium]|nr:type II secretion system protein GspK [Candidatus Omnitrophota bacterium]